MKPQIQHFAELKGKTLGLSLPVDTISICLKRGECDAVPLGQPEDFVAMGEGLPEIGCVDGGSGGIPIPGRCRAAGWAQENRDAVVRFVRALAAAFGSSAIPPIARR